MTYHKPFLPCNSWINERSIIICWTKKMKYTLIILNLLAAAWMWFFSPISQKADEVHMYSQVRELEQASVIGQIPVFLSGISSRT